MLKIILSVSLVIFLHCTNVLALSRDTTQCIAVLNQLEASYNGKTESNNNYRLFAIKRKREWIVLVTDSVNVTAFNNKKRRDLTQRTDFYRNNVCHIVSSMWLLKKEERKSIDGLPVFCYYEFTKEGKKFYKSFAKVEAMQDVNQKMGFVKKKWNALKKLIGGPFKKQTNTIDKQLKNVDKVQKTTVEKKQAAEELKSNQ